MNVELKLSTADDACIIRNLWPLYVHDVSEFDGGAPNRHGILGGDDGLETLAAQGETQNGWWRKPESLFPYLILADGRPAGFNLIATRPYVPEGVDADFLVHEFFVLHAFRGNGVARRAAVQGFEAHRGRWEIVTYPAHARAVAFWRKVILDYDGDGASEEERDHPWGRRVVFRFDNVR